MAELLGILGIEPPGKEQASEFFLRRANVDSKTYGKEAWEGLMHEGSAQGPSEGYGVARYENGELPDVKGECIAAMIHIDYTDIITLHDLLPKGRLLLTGLYRKGFSGSVFGVARGKVASLVTHSVLIARKPREQSIADAKAMGDFLLAYPSFVGAWYMSGNRKPTSKLGSGIVHLAEKDGMWIYPDIGLTNPYSPIFESESSTLKNASSIANVLAGRRHSMTYSNLLLQPLSYLDIDVMKERKYYIDTWDTMTDEEQDEFRRSDLHNVKDKLEVVQVLGAEKLFRINEGEARSAGEQTLRAANSDPNRSDINGMVQKRIKQFLNPNELERQQAWSRAYHWMRDYKSNPDDRTYLEYLELDDPDLLIPLVAA